jgi:hypothetical protein
MLASPSIVEKRLERGTRLAAAARRAVELGIGELAPADERENAAGPRIDRHERRLQVALWKAAEPRAHRLLRRVLQRRHERRPHLPVGRVIAAEAFAKQLAQILLRVAAARIHRARIRPDPDARPDGFALLRFGDETFLPHPRQDDMAALDRAVEIRPRRQGRGRPREPGDERALGEVQLFGRPAEEVPRHRLDAVDPGAQVDAIEVELEHLRFRELGVDHHRQHRFTRLAAVGLLVREEERARELLRQRAPALDGAGRSHVAHDGAAERDRIDAGMRVETVILDGDERMLEVFGDLGERNVAPVFVHPEPAASVGGEEPRVADAARQAVDGPALPKEPRDADDGEDHQDREEARGNPVANGVRARSHVLSEGRGARRWSTADSAT